MSIKRDAADNWFSKCVRARDQHCMVCGKTEGLDCCHVYGRRNKAVRWSLDNAITMCRYHHREMGESPARFMDFLEDVYGPGHLEILREKANAIMKTNRELRLEIAKFYREQYRAWEADPDGHRWVSYN